MQIHRPGIEGGVKEKGKKKEWERERREWGRDMLRKEGESRGGQRMGRRDMRVGRER